MTQNLKDRIRRALTPIRGNARAFLAAVLVVAFAAACDVHGISDPGTLVSITVTPNATLIVGGTQQMVAVGYDAEGRAVSITPTWSIAASGGTVASTGMFTAGGLPGQYNNTVVATVGSISGNASITVLPGPMASITVVPTPVTLAVLGTQQFTAVGKDVAGNVIAFEPTWSVVAGGGAIAQTGIFTAGGTPGTFTNTVQASYNALKGFATVIVTPGPMTTMTITPNPSTLGVGAMQQFTVVGKDAAGNVIAFTPIWSVVAGGGTIDNVGLFTAGSTLGTFANTVKATSGTISATATVDVVAGALATITVTPNPATMVVSTTRQFTAVGQDAGGNIVVITPDWDVVTAGNGANITQGGLYTAGTVVGTFPNKVRASSGGISGYATTIETTGALASITVTPTPVFLQTGGTQQFTAVGRDGSGNVFPITPDWSVVNGGGAINSTTGLFTAGLVAGTFNNTVRATSGTISGSATVNVAATLALIVVTPNPVSVEVSGTQQFSAVGRDGSGNPFPISPVWSVVAGGGTINAGTGLFTAGLVTGTYTQTVKATSGSFSGTATVTVTATPPSLKTITVTPNPASMLVNATQQFAAIGRDELGNIFPVVPVWTVVNGGGTINALTGLFTAGAVTGAFTNTVKATDGSGLISGTATVNVTVVETSLIDFGIAAPNGIMAGASVTCSGLGVVNADISISPGSTLSGFGPCIFTGVTHLGDPTAALAQIALTGAYNTLMGQPCPPANDFGTVNYGGKVLPAGVYCSATSINVTGALTLDGGGDPNATFVFQAGSSLIGAASIVLINSAQAKNVYWVVGSSATLNASAWKGNIVALTTIELKVNTNLLGRALARNGSVTLDATSNVITLP